MTRPNAEFALPLGDRDEPALSPPAHMPSSPVAERVPSRRPGAQHARQVDVIKTRIATKRQRHQAIWDDLAKLKMARTEQLRAELSASRRSSKSRRRPGANPTR